MGSKRFSFHTHERLVGYVHDLIRLVYKTLLKVPSFSLLVRLDYTHMLRLDIFYSYRVLVLQPFDPLDVSSDRGLVGVDFRACLSRRQRWYVTKVVDEDFASLIIEGSLIERENLHASLSRASIATFLLSLVLLSSCLICGRHKQFGRRRKSRY